MYHEFPKSVSLIHKFLVFNVSFRPWLHAAVYFFPHCSRDSISPPCTHRRLVSSRDDELHACARRLLFRAERYASKPVFRLSPKFQTSLFFVSVTPPFLPLLSLLFHQLPPRKQSKQQQPNSICLVKLFPLRSARVACSSATRAGR